MLERHVSECRALEAENLERANQANDPGIRHLYETIAQGFRHLAEVIETGPGYATGGPPIALSAAIANLTDANPPFTLVIQDTADHVINAAEATSVGFTVAGLNSNDTATVTFIDDLNHQVGMNITGDGSYSANLSGLDDGTITSALVASGPGNTTSVAGSTITLDTDRNLTPTITVNAANPTGVTFTVGGLEGDEHGNVTFTDTNGVQDVVPI